MVEKQLRITQVISMLCNGHCSYCMCGDELTHMATKDEADIEDLISFYSKIDSNILFIFKITGGEPLHPLSINKTIRLAKYMLDNKNIKFLQINTNGYFDIPECLLDDKRIQFQFSLDGTKEYQNKVVGLDIYDRLIANMDKVRSHGINAHIMTVVTEDNYSQVYKIAKVAKEHNMGFQMQYVSPVGSASNYEKNEKLAKYRINMLSKFYPNCCRQFIETCSIPKDSESDTFNYSVDEKGNIILCPYMRKYKSGLTIYNTDPNDRESIRNNVNNVIQGRSCSKPELENEVK